MPGRGNGLSKGPEVGRYPCLRSSLQAGTFGGMEGRGGRLEEERLQANRGQIMQGLECYWEEVGARGRGLSRAARWDLHFKSLFLAVY